MRRSIVLAAVCVAALSGCATLTEDAMTPVALSFSDGSAGSCNLYNKRGAWHVPMPSVASVRKSDDPLRYDCSSTDGRKAFGAIPSEMGGKIIASAVFLDFGITDAITDKHRRYASSYVVPLAPASQPAVSAPAPSVQQAKPVTSATTSTAPAPATGQSSEDCESCRDIVETWRENH